MDLPIQNTVIMPEASANQPVTPQLPSKKSIAPLIATGIAIFVAVLAIAGYLFMANQKLKAQLAIAPSPTPQATTAVLPVASTSAIDPTSGWTRYTNPEYGITFLYNPDWKIAMESSFPSSEHVVRIANIAKGNDTLEVFAQEYSGDLSLDAYIDRYGGDTPTKSGMPGTLTDNVTIGSLTGTYIVFPTAVKTKFDTSGVAQHFYVRHATEVFWIRLMEGAQDQLTQTDKDYFKEILTSFKFL